MNVVEVNSSGNTKYYVCLIFKIYYLWVRNKIRCPNVILYAWTSGFSSMSWSGRSDQYGNIKYIMYDWYLKSRSLWVNNRMSEYITKRLRTNPMKIFKRLSMVESYWKQSNPTYRILTTRIVDKTTIPLPWVYYPLTTRGLFGWFI